MNTLFEQLIRDEGMVLTPYRDSVGKWTIGVGHNLEAKGITKRVALAILEDDIADARRDLENLLPQAALWTEPRQAVLINMVFNLGIGGFSQFHKMIECLEANDWEWASRAMLDSKWAAQVGARAVRLAAQMRTGEWVQ